MSFGNAVNHHHHGKQYPHWDTSDSYQQYQISESTEVMPEKLNLYPEVYESYNINGYEEREVVIHDQTPERVRVRTEYEFAPQQPLKPSRHHYHHHVDSKDVDKEAEEFIKAEHRMFGLSKMMSRTDSRLRPYNCFPIDKNDKGKLCFCDLDLPIARNIGNYEVERNHVSSQAITQLSLR